MTAFAKGTMERLIAPGFVFEMASTVVATVPTACFSTSSRETVQPLGVSPMDMDTSRASANSNSLMVNSTVTSSSTRDGLPPPNVQRFANA